MKSYLDIINEFTEWFCNSGTSNDMYYFVLPSGTYRLCYVIDTDDDLQMLDFEDERDLAAYCFDELDRRDYFVDPDTGEYEDDRIEYMDLLGIPSSSYKQDIDRISELLDGCTAWIWDHCFGETDQERYLSYIFALKECGFDKCEIADDLINELGLSQSESNMLMRQFESEV